MNNRASVVVGYKKEKKGEGVRGPQFGKCIQCTLYI